MAGMGLGPSLLPRSTEATPICTKGVYLHVNKDVLCDISKKVEIPLSAPKKTAAGAGIFTIPAIFQPGIYVHHDNRGKEPVSFNLRVHFTT